MFLSEAHTSFGGMSTIGRIPLSMKWSDGIRDMDAGFGALIRRKLGEESHLKGPATDIEALKRVYDREAESAGVDFAFYSRVIGVEARDGRIDHAVVSSPSGLCRPSSALSRTMYKAMQSIQTTIFFSF